MRIDVKTVDRHIEFLRGQIDRMDNLASGGARWAAANADQMRDIKTVLETLRREQQMTGMNGRPIG